MCGILGIFTKNQINSTDLASAFSKIEHRGRDGFGFCTEKELVCTKNKKEFIAKLKQINRIKQSKYFLVHNLHSVVGFALQPLVDKEKNSKFVFNGEIYNWKELKDKYKIKAENDSELLFKIIEKKGTENLKKTLKKVDGVYAFAYLDENNKELFVARDIIGVKPVWFSSQDGFSFCSEKKALEKLDYVDIVELNPRKILKYDLEKDKIEFIEREFFEIEPKHTEPIEKIKKQVEKLLTKALKKRLPDKKLGILFSGGIDSTVLALLCKKLGYEFTCYTAVLDDPALKVPEDLVYAKKIAKEYGFPLKIIKIKLEDVEKYLKKIVPLIEDNNVVKVGVALPFFAACEQAKKDNCKVILSGLGSEEIFAGYQRHKELLKGKDKKISMKNINKECVSGVLKLYERDMYRDDVVTMFHSLELRLPFLDKKLIEYSLKIPAKYKLSEDREKIILREVAKDLGLKEEYAERKKKAAQYGSNFDKALAKLTKKSGLKLKSEYLRRFYPTHNLKLGALFSSGKDSTFAVWIMLKQNYSVDCLITVKSHNPDSYMFHTPNIDLVELQAKAMNIQLVTQETKGEKEKELIDLKNAIKKAKSIYKIEGVITGALFSNYQRNRIEKICDELGLKIFSPLWHMNQEQEMRQLIDNGFKIIFSSIAADGLDKSWLGREITQKDVDKLVELNEKIGFNVALEGGEAESLVLDCPLFKKKLVVKKAEKKMENDFTGKFDIEKIELVEKN